MSIELIQERVRELFDYDEESGILIRKTFKSGKRKPCGNKPNRKGYGTVSIGGKKYTTHRIIWLWFYGSWPNREIDHIDRNPMNNKIDNLRDVSNSENNHNRGLQRNNSTGYPGVHWDKTKKKYIAQIKSNNKLIRLGRFAAAEEAYLAYQLAKIEYHPSSPVAKEYFKSQSSAFWRYL